MDRRFDVKPVPDQTAVAGYLLLDPGCRIESGMTVRGDFYDAPKIR